MVDLCLHANFAAFASSCRYQLFRVPLSAWRLSSMAGTCLFSLFCVNSHICRYLLLAAVDLRRLRVL